ncbi:MAG: type I methionyl aminopeptidase [Erysipelotrichaceae bacterium]|nr:type I methionyl aminopeptidase [Erysipelotrichaceae bacterium]
MITIKNSREIELMRHAGHVVGLVHQKMAEVLKPGMTTQEVADICEKVIRDNGCTPSFLNLYGFPGAVCTSVNDVVVHGIPSDYVLQDGDVISVDVGACWKGYHGDSAWTYAVGNVSDDVKHLMEVTEAALYAGLEQVKPGNRVSDISHAVQVYLESHGCTTPRDYTGHGIGTAVHEDPTVPNWGEPGRGPRLRKGMCIAVEPMAHLGGEEVYTLDDDWTVVTRDHSLAAHYEHTVAITDSGYEIMTKV